MSCFATDSVCLFVCVMCMLSYILCPRFFPCIIAFACWWRFCSSFFRVTLAEHTGDMCAVIPCVLFYKNNYLLALVLLHFVFIFICFVLRLQNGVLFVVQTNHFSEKNRAASQKKTVLELKFFKKSKFPADFSLYNVHEPDFLSTVSSELLQLMTNC